MQSAIWHSQQSRPQLRPQLQPQFHIRQPGPYMTTTTAPSASMTTWPYPRFPSTNPRFPPAPPSSPPPTLAYPRHSSSVTPPCSPTIPCAPTQLASPSTPSIPSSPPRHSGTPFSKSPGAQSITDESRTYGFDLNPHWQEDQDHYDNQKINGLTSPEVFDLQPLHKSWISRDATL